MGLYPFIEVTVNGNPARDTFYSRLISATIHDAPGQEADTIELEFDDNGNVLEIPPTGALIVAHFGFRDSGSQKMGAFKMDKPSIKGGSSGEFLRLSGNSADMRSDIKEPLTEHFDDADIGTMVSDLAKRHGFSAKISDELASIKLPYIARYEQSTADFLTRLADRTGGLFAVKDGKFLFLKRGILSAVTIDRSECEDWSFDIEPRPLHSKVEAGWFDQASGSVKYENVSTGLKGTSTRLRNIFTSKAEAEAAARSESSRLGRGTGSGSITLAGRPDILADAPVNATGFRPECNGLWRCGGVDHVYQDTYMTTIDLEAPEEGKQ